MRSRACRIEVVVRLGDVRGESSRWGRAFRSFGAIVHAHRVGYLFCREDT